MIRRSTLPVGQLPGTSGDSEIPIKGPAGAGKRGREPVVGTTRQVVGRAKTLLDFH